MTTIALTTYTGPLDDNRRVDLGDLALRLDDLSLAVTASHDNFPPTPESAVAARRVLSEVVDQLEACLSRARALLTGVAEPDVAALARRWGKLRRELSDSTGWASGVWRRLLESAEADLAAAVAE